MTELEALAVRCEQATGPCRELDCAIQIALTPNAQCMTYPGHGTIGSSFGSMSEIDLAAWEAHRSGLLGAFYYGAPPAYTASLDAAMGLVPARMGWHLQGNTSVFYAVVYGQYSEACTTPALALTAASLRAIAGTSQEQEG